MLLPTSITIENSSYNIIDSITEPTTIHSDKLLDNAGQMAVFTGYGWDAAVYEYTIENNDGLYLLYYYNYKESFDGSWSYFAYYDSSYNLIQTYNILKTKNDEIIESYVPILSNVKYIRVCMNLTTNLISSKIVRIDYSTQTIKDVVVRNSNNINNINDDIADINNDINEIRHTIDSIIIDPSFNQWSGKTWYAYGTSITSVSQGTYVPYLAEMLNMNVVNKGIGGGGIGDLGAYSHGQVRNALMNTTDGKLNADLITLETTANDTGPNVPIGDIYDTDETTLCGCLNMCLRYLQKYTTAQIVVFTSVSITTEPSLEQSYYNTMLKYRDVCFINRVYWVDAGANLGWGKISNDRTYTKDNIHQTSLGGYILAKNLYYQIRNIPIFDKQLPS